jgi:DNA-binding transcriptional MerR regulator
MSETPMKVGEIALQLGVDRNTIRNWCRRYAAHLSEGANPPPGGQRIFTTRDANVLAYIHTAMNDGVNHDEIAIRLGEKTFNEGEIDIVVGETPVQPTTPVEMPPETTRPASDAPEAPILLPVLLTSIDKRIDALERAQQHGMTMFWRGAVLGLIGALALFTVAYLLVTTGMQ